MNFNTIRDLKITVSLLAVETDDPAGAFMSVIGEDEYTTTSKTGSYNGPLENNLQS